MSFGSPPNTKSIIYISGKEEEIVRFGLYIFYVHEEEANINYGEIKSTHSCTFNLLIDYVVER